MIRLGCTEEQLEEVFREMYHDLGPAQEREIESVIRNCVKLAGQDLECDPKSWRRKQEAERITFETSQQRPQILTNYEWPYEAIRGSGGLADLPLALHRSTFLRKMFEPDDIIWIGKVWSLWGGRVCESL